MTAAQNGGSSSTASLSCAGSSQPAMSVTGTGNPEIARNPRVALPRNVARQWTSNGQAVPKGSNVRSSKYRPGAAGLHAATFPDQSRPSVADRGVSQRSKSLSFLGAPGQPP